MSAELVTIERILVLLTLDLAASARPYERDPVQLGHV
jgi:hypothetical protein